MKFKPKTKTVKQLIEALNQDQTHRNLVQRRIKACLSCEAPYTHEEMMAEHLWRIEMWFGACWVPLAGVFSRRHLAEKYLWHICWPSALQPAVRLRIAHAQINN